MASSVDSANTDPDVAQAGTRTPTHHPQVTSAAAATELSPPGSQPQTFPAISTASEIKTTETDAQQRPGKGTDAAIAAWKSKRAQEEFDRAMEQVVDTDFNLGMCHLYLPRYPLVDVLVNCSV